ncbi:MAG: MFS transporter, partial [Clostridia bacterium]|nr:MFS transporter [Clostridia bacterium]
AILGGPMFIGMFGAMVIVPKLCDKLEKKTVYNGTSVIGAIPFGLIFVAYLIDGTGLYKPVWLPVLAVLFFVAGAGTGASGVIQSIMIADCVDYDEYHTGYRPDGVFFSGQSFITKLGAGLSSFIQGIVFAAVGFSGDAVKACNETLAASAATDFMFATAPEFEPYRFGMFFLITIPAFVSSLLSVIPMKNYEIDNKEYARILGELNAKRNAG